MISHKDEMMMGIIRRAGWERIFEAARYVMQLESYNRDASLIADKVNNLAFPLKYTGAERPKEAVTGSLYLVRIIVGEQIMAEERFREMLVDMFRDTKDMQKDIFGESFDVGYEDAYKITKDLKISTRKDPMEESDDEILEKILFIIDLSCGINSFDEEDDYEDEVYP